ncbi:DUF2808 domain-containing protein [Cyanobium sp. CH-040]|uniref:DUF2808 domain-containing protein n=1 Tax=Cyanobium sp. CH-040 TaxID=2823708 RepID=UPI0020CCE7D4|nr:DUF2808 domain-containing protein [Cyanobium sp. CH-040]MCP9928921.1 DUF2808 domain-containing protein [Cyanobium sp. CH-040]
MARTGALICLALGVAPWLGAPGAPPVLAPALALELRGSTYFARPPWKVDLVSYRTDAGDPLAEYFFTVELDPAAGASLGGLQIRQSEGPDSNLPFSPDRTRAFLGRPRGGGAPIPVEAEFMPREGEVRVRFPQPVPPGSTVTVMLKPWFNPSMPGTYLFQVTAFPDGPNPNPTSLGSARLRIYRPDWR